MNINYDDLLTMTMTITIKNRVGIEVMNETIPILKHEDERRVLVDFLQENHVVLCDGDTITINID